jgi:hypothetical protein
MTPHAVFGSFEGPRALTVPAAAKSFFSDFSSRLFRLTDSARMWTDFRPFRTPLTLA